MGVNEFIGGRGCLRKYKQLLWTKYRSVTRLTSTNRSQPRRSAPHFDDVHGTQLCNAYPMLLAVYQANVTLRPAATAWHACMWLYSYKRGLFLLMGLWLTFIIRMTAQSQLWSLISAFLGIARPGFSGYRTHWSLEMIRIVNHTHKIVLNWAIALLSIEWFELSNLSIPSWGT